MGFMSHIMWDSAPVSANAVNVDCKVFMLARCPKDDDCTTQPIEVLSHRGKRLSDEELLHQGKLIAKR